MELAFVRARVVCHQQGNRNNDRRAKRVRRSAQAAMTVSYIRSHSRLLLDLWFSDFDKAFSDPCLPSLGEVSLSLFIDLADAHRDCLTAQRLSAAGPAAKSGPAAVAVLEGTD